MTNTLNVSKKWLIYPALLIFAHLLAHFLPFERESLSPDDYADLLTTQNRTLSELPANMLRNPDRPLNLAALTLQLKWTKDDPGRGLILTFLSSLTLLLVVYTLFHLLLGDPFTAFIAAFIFGLLPHKLETYHYPGSAHINIVLSVYLLSLIFFILSVHKKSAATLALSLVCYTIGIFWYEVGFFMPLLFASYLFLQPRDENVIPSSKGARNLRRIFFFSFTLYVIPAVGYLLYRLTGVFGLASQETLQHTAGLSSVFMTAADLLHHYFGRTFIKNLLYGSYQFFSIEQPWFILIFIANLILLFFLYRSVRNNDLSSLQYRLGIFSVIFFLITIGPVFLNAHGGIAGRHLLLPSVAVSIALVAGLRLLPYWKPALIALSALLLVICEGNSWSQLMAARINGSVYRLLKEKKGDLQRADHIVIDTRSFADAIPYSWQKRNFNVLNTYYGAQAFEEWGLISMVYLVLGDDVDKPRDVYVATESPVLETPDTLSFFISDLTGYRQNSHRRVTLPAKNSLVIDVTDLGPKRDPFHQ